MVNFIIHRLTTRHGRRVRRQSVSGRSGDIGITWSSQFAVCGHFELHVTHANQGAGGAALETVGVEDVKTTIQLVSCIVVPRFIVRCG